MGTRGFLGFVADGTEKIAYTHWGGSPDGVGLDMLRWLRSNQHELVCAEHGSVVDSATNRVRKLRVVDGDSTPTAEDIERLAPFTDLGVSRQSTTDWYCLLRHTQDDPAAMLQAGVVVDNSDFPLDSLMCEFGALVDLDAQTFEAYAGFQKQPHDKGRFAGRKGIDEYAPVALAATYPLAELPTDEEFLAALEEDDES